MEYTELNINIFKNNCDNGRLIGIDLGTKFIGIAICDVNQKVASPIKTINRTKFKVDAQEITDIINNQNIKGAVIGWPVNMNGSQGKKCQQTNDFRQSFRMYSNIPFLYWDERLTTVEAERTLIQGDMSRQKRKKYVNHIAAAIILQSAIERLNQM